LVKLVQVFNQTAIYRDLKKLSVSVQTSVANVNFFGMLSTLIPEHETKCSSNHK
jgi:hypothetical protein